MSICYFQIDNRQSVQSGDSHKNSAGNRRRYQYYGWISDGQDDPYIKGYADDLCSPKEEGHTQRYIRQKPSKITQSQLAAQLGIDIITIKYYVRNLSKNIVIERKGNNRSGEWVVLISDYTKWRQKYSDNACTEDFQAAAIAYAKNNPS